MENLEQLYNDRLEQLRIELAAAIPTREEDALPFLTRSDWDDSLARFVIWSEATPRALAAFCAENRDLHAELIEDLWNDPPLMQQMLVADGAARCRGGARNAAGEGPAQYGPAMKIYAEIQSESEQFDSRDNRVLQRLALAIALEHAVPIAQTNPADCGVDNDGAVNKFVDPVRRYLKYEMAFIDGELDPSFSALTTWELRHVVNGDESDEVSAWGRRMLRHFRPDHILNPDSSWRYVNVVRSDVRYGSQDVGNDSPHLHKYQNILANGGVCGRRAFFGRFILRAFGIPTTARPSRGHGALCHWTQDKGWVVNLGGGWGAGWTKTVYGNDMDFLATTQARRVKDAYKTVKRAQWIGDAMGERRVYGAEELKRNGPCGLWNALSLKIQQEIIDSGTVPQCIRVERKVPEADREAIIHHPDGSISIPAALKESKSKNVTVMATLGDGGGRQIYLPPFSPQGQTVLRGGSWKCATAQCVSGHRLLSGGYGQYHDWGFRVALSVSSSDGHDLHPQSTKTLDLGGGVTLELVYIQPGKFVMGGECTEDGRFACVEVPKHPVAITRGYYLGKYPVTQAQYEQVMGDRKKNPSKSTRAPDCPVDNIGEADALNFCRAFSERAGGDVRLPTEAEWEYACRSGCGDAHWFFGDDQGLLGEYAWFGDNAGGGSHPVGRKAANAWGLHDMYGNVWERVADRYEKSYYGSGADRAVDPEGPKQGVGSQFEYKVSLQRAGKYSLCATVVTVNVHQRLNVSLKPFSADNNTRFNTGDNGVHVLILPFTLGEWQDSLPVFLQLPEGETTLYFWRDKPPQYGIAIKKFNIQPI
mmetsp:Transcript_24762/g.36320  ORF Transcript_24762/g.36320 Transcript_24762/m.36320 type:complete len:817 (-) Transcript_24762:541-2991(-)